MSYSTLFTSGLSLASQPRTEADSLPRPPSLQINVLPSTPRPRTRKRRSSLTIATSPISIIKSPARTANDAVRSAFRSPREATFLEALQNGATRPRIVRRKTVSHVNDFPCFPAPTSPLPTLPTLRVDFPRASYSSSAPITPTDEVYPSSPIAADMPIPSRPAQYTESLRANHSRKSSILLPFGRGPLSLSPYAGNKDSNELDIGMLVEEKDTATVWFDDDEDMKENDRDA